jgi:hypothetical protein
MTNTIIIDIDSERDRQILFSKPSTIPQPTTTEEAKEMVITDIKCVTEALYSMIKTASDNGYCDKNVTINSCMLYLHNKLIDENE